MSHPSIPFIIQPPEEKTYSVRKTITINGVPYISYAPHVKGYVLQGNETLIERSEKHEPMFPDIEMYYQDFSHTFSEEEKAVIKEATLPLPIPLPKTFNTKF